MTHTLTPQSARPHYKEMGDKEAQKTCNAEATRALADEVGRGGVFS